MAKSFRDSWVFVNIAYGAPYERLLAALTVALVAIGRIPRLTFQVAETGSGRRERIWELIQDCPVSLHDFSAVGLPVRFCMPLEAGMALAHSLTHAGRRHTFCLLDRTHFRLQKTCSDLNGIDVKVHYGTAEGMIGAVLNALERRGGNPPAQQVLDLYNEIMRDQLPGLKAIHRVRTIFHREIFNAFVAVVADSARRQGIHPLTARARARL